MGAAELMRMALLRRCMGLLAAQLVSPYVFAFDLAHVDLSQRISFPTVLSRALCEYPPQ